MSLKILQATEYFLPDVERGIERFVYELSRGLIGAGQDVFVPPSKEEAGGLVVLEAMASGAPVVCSDTGGITEYIRNGYMAVYESAVKA